MSSNATTHPWRAPLARAAVFRAVGLSTIGLIGWHRSSSADGPAWSAVSLVAVLALAALVGVAWYLPRARAESRWRDALDRYADQQAAKQTDPRAGPVALSPELGAGAERSSFRPEDEGHDRRAWGTNHAAGEL